jgi:hypothetical protein
MRIITGVHKTKGGTGFQLFSRVFLEITLQGTTPKDLVENEKKGRRKTEPTTHEWQVFSP